MKTTILCTIKSLIRGAARSWVRLSIAGVGAAALLWFLVRVIPKPSRASYPCQRAAFPVASGFVIWLCGFAAIRFGLMRRTCGRLAACGGVLAVLVMAGWTLISFTGAGSAQNTPRRPTDWNFIPAKPNNPVGIARGVNPGRVVWARDPQATKWAGHWKQDSDQWWLDENTDQSRVDALLAATLVKLTSATNDENAWQAIFEYYNKRARQMEKRGYEPGEVVAVKINLNNSSSGKTDNYTDASPQMVLAMVRQLVKQAHVRQEDIIIYDVRRMIPPYLLTKIWSEFKDVRFLQEAPPTPDQPKHPVYGDYRRLEGAKWVEGVSYSKGKYKNAKLIARQIFDATYLVNLALLKAHSYPYNTMEDGDSGQTAVTLTGKNHFGSIKGTPELHAAINTDQEGTPHAYSPMVDLAASPNLGGKTVLFVLDGLYSGRKWRTYPVHFPNPPFNNRVEPYENPDWPASVLVSMDGVALDSVGLDILLAQTRNNNDTNGHPRILIRANADDYLFEMAQVDHPPSGTVYRQDGKIVSSLGVHEHWDSDNTKRYSRNLDPAQGKGIELIYLPLGAAANQLATAVAETPATVPPVPAVLPGIGLSQYDFFYAGESKVERMFIVRGGQIVWDYTHPAQGEISDAIWLTNGDILFAHQHGVTEVNANKQVVWNHDAPVNTEIHTAMLIGTNSAGFVQNGDPAKFIVINKGTGQTENEFNLPVANPRSTHGQFRHARLTAAGTLLVAHMDLGKVVEYDLTGKELWSLPVPGVWSATPLDNGNILVVSNRKFVRELTRQGDVVWEWTPADTPEYPMSNLQLATRLPNGNTLINDWFNQWSGEVNPATAEVQAIEVTPSKKVVWTLRSWSEPANLGPATTIQILPKS